MSDEQILDALWHRCAYTVGEDSYFFLTAGEAAKEDLEDVNDPSRLRAPG